MNLADAAAYQDALDAVLSGNPTLAQCHEVIAVTFALRGYLQEADLRARAFPERRQRYEALLPEDKRSPPDTSKPRIVFIKQTGEVMTIEAYEAREAQRAAADAKAADQAALVALATKTRADADARAAEVQRATDTRAAAERVRIAAENAAAERTQLADEAAQRAAVLAAEVASQTVAGILASYGIKPPVDTAIEAMPAEITAAPKA